MSKTTYVATCSWIISLVFRMSTANHISAGVYLFVSLFVGSHLSHVPSYIITVISESTAMGDELKWLLKEGGGLFGMF